MASRLARSVVGSSDGTGFATDNPIDTALWRVMSPTPDASLKWLRQGNRWCRWITELHCDWLTDILSGFRVQVPGGVRDEDPPANVLEGPLPSSGRPTPAGLTEPTLSPHTVCRPSRGRWPSASRCTRVRRRGRSPPSGLAGPDAGRHRSSTSRLLLGHPPLL
jgi:hypothetical protein